MSVARRYALLFVLNLLATTEFWSLYTAISDEAMGVVGAQQILHGAWPYRDFDTDITPGIYMLGAVWFGMVGVSTLTVRLLLSLISASTSLAVQGCADRVLQGRWRYLPWLLWTTGGIMEFPVLNHHWLGIGFTMFGWYFALGWCSSDRRIYRLGLGVCVTLAGWSIQSEGLALTLTVIFVWLRCRPRGLLEVVAAAGLTGVLAWLPCLLQGQAGAIVQQNVIGITYHLKHNKNPYSLSNVQEFLGHYSGLTPAVGWLAFCGASSHIFINVLRYLSLPVLALAALIGSERRGRNREKVLAYAWLASLLASQARMTFLYVSFQNPGWALVMTLVLSWIPRGAYLAATLAGLEVSGWMVRGLLRRQLYLYPISTRIGVYYSLDPGEAAGATELAGWIAGYLPPGTPVMCFPYAANLYSAYQLQLPVRRILMPPGEVAPEEYVAMHRHLLEKRIPWMIYVHVNVAEVSGNYDIDPQRLEKQWVELRQLMTDGYRLVEGNERVGLYRLKE